jgi:putative ABC transport system permease protein
LGAGRALRGAWWRRDLTLGMGLVVAVTTAAAVAAPSFAGAAVADLVRERLAAADRSSTDLSWAVGMPDPRRDLRATVDDARRLTDDADGGFGRPVVSAAALLDGDFVDTRNPVLLAWHEGLCEQVQLAGRCPDGPGEVLLPAGPMARQHPPGTAIEVRQPPSDDASVAGRSLRLTVVGTWVTRELGDDAPDDTAWWHAGDEVPTLTACDGTPTTITTAGLGPLLTDLETLQALPAVSLLADASLAATSDVDRARAAADYAEQWQEDPEPRPLAGGGCAAAVSDSDIDEVLGPVDDERSRLQRQGTGAAAGTVLIGILATVLISSLSARRRRGEVALMKLRGLRGVRLLREAMVEPIVVLGLGAAVGIPLGWCVARVATKIWLGPDVATPLPTAAWSMAGLVLVLAVCGVAVGMLRTLREPVHLQLRPPRPQPKSAVAVVGRVMAFVGAVVGVYELRRSGASDPPWWALSMPVILGFVVGATAGWLIRAGARILATISHRRRGNGVFLGSRRLVRSGDTLTYVPFAMAAIVLVVVAGGAWDVGSQWRESTALLRTGGPVAIGSGKDAATTLAATRRVDPDGRWLMTALSFPDDAGRTYRRIFVDTGRWDRVLGPALESTPSDVPSDLRPEVRDALAVQPRPDPGLIRGTTITLSARTDAMWFRSYERAELRLVLERADGLLSSVSLFLGAHDRGSVSVARTDCREGCRPLRLDLLIRSDAANWVTGDLTIERLQLGGTDLMDLDWQLSPPNPRVSLADAGDAWRLQSKDASIGLSLPHASSAMPVVTAGIDPGSPENPAGPGHAFDARGRPVPATVVDEVAALPLIGDEGVLGDLPAFLANDPTVPSVSETFVLARADTPPSVLAALRATGVDTGDVRQVSESRRLLDHDPYAQGLRFFWLVAAMVGVIAACTVGVAVRSQRPVRARDGAALRVVGVRRRQLRTAVVVEVGILASLLGACGWVGAWASSWAILPVLPLGHPEQFEPGPQVTTTWMLGAVPALGSAALLAIATLVLLLPMSVRARPSTLRSGGE